MRLGIAHHLGWAVAEREQPASSALAADEVLLGPRATLGSPWTNAHRMALAATIVAG